MQINTIVRYHGLPTEMIKLERLLILEATMQTPVKLKKKNKQTDRLKKRVKRQLHNIEVGSMFQARVGYLKATYYMC